MVNFDGNLIDDHTNFLNHQNRAFGHGDALVERVRLVEGKLIFWEDHYFRITSSMRILRMQIPMTFTMEFLEREILKTIENTSLDLNFEIQLFIFRKVEQEVVARPNSISYLIESSPLSAPFFELQNQSFEVELFKDYYISFGLLSTLNTSNKILQTIAQVFAKENGYQAAILLNTNKQVIGSTFGNIFMVKDDAITTAPLEDGAKNTVIRKKTIESCKNWKGYVLQEASISPFDLQKADELFIVDDINGLIPITKYRKKQFATVFAKQLLGRLNALARFLIVS